jgi:hypothetical protein
VTLSADAGPALHPEVCLLQTAWNDIDNALDDMSEADVLRQISNGSSIAWTLAHVTHGVDSWFNVRFQGMQPHQLYAGGRFLFGGDGRATDWDTIRTGVNEVRKRAMPWLLDSATDFDLIVPYEGSYLPFRRHGMQLRAAVLQNAFHHVFHLGEIVTKREWLGYSTDRFPGDYTVAILRGSD